jgi:hypothetical protein
MGRQFFGKISRIRFSSCFMRVDGWTDRQTDGAMLIGAPQGCRRAYVVVNTLILMCVIHSLSNYRHVTNNQLAFAVPSFV